MAYLYRNVTGKLIHAHSHSGGQDFSCPRRYKYKRLDGWQSREEKPAFEFGKRVESAIKYYHLQNFEEDSGVDEFKKLWWSVKDDDTLEYTDKGGSWEDHYKMGCDLLKLYEVMLPELPISKAQFSIEKKVPLFSSGHEFEGLEYMAIADLICQAPNRHPSLPKIDSEEEFRPLIVDIKTSASAYYKDPRLSSLDDQLRDYSWVFGIETVSFLVLIKNFSGIDTGDWVSVLRGPRAGKKYQVLFEGANGFYLASKTLYDEYNSRKKLIKGSTKQAIEQREVLLTEYVFKAHSEKREDLTKTGIQFLPAVISKQDREEAEEVARQEAMEISCCSNTNFFPKKPGVRFPHNHCLTCDCLGLCIGDPELTKEKLIKIDGIF